MYHSSSTVLVNLPTRFIECSTRSVIIFGGKFGQVPGLQKINKVSRRAESSGHLYTDRVHTEVVIRFLSFSFLFQFLLAVTYGSEAWGFDDRARSVTNGVNARLFSRFTRKDTHREVNSMSRTYDLVEATRETRMKWLGHLLRLRGKRYFCATS